MDLNQQMLSELAAQLGLEDNSQDSVDAALEMADEYRNKKDDALVSEIRRLKKTMRTDTEQYKKQISALKGLRSMLSEEQQKNLDKVLLLLDE